MDNKKIRKISKKELLEVLLSQAKRIEELELELSDTKKKLTSKKIMIDESGSIADASIKINEIFECAQKTADQYLFNVMEKCKKIEKDAKKLCEKEKNKIIKETEKYCEQKKKVIDKKLASINKDSSKKVKNSKGM